MTSHWDRLGETYDQEWTAPAKQELSRVELEFVTRHLATSTAQRVLDVGVGSGRVLGALLGDERVERVVGMDASPEMVAVCRQRFGDDPKLEALHVRDVATDGPPDDGPFDFVSAVRVLKYQVAWREVLAALVASVAPGGVVVLTMPNRRSLNAVARRYAVPWHTTTRAELRALAEELGVELLELTAFTKLPFFAYSRPRRRWAAAVPLLADRVLARLVGSERFGRELFVALRVPG